MKYLWKRLLCIALCLCALFSSALAEAVDKNLYIMTDYSDADAVTVRSAQAVGASLYLLKEAIYSNTEEGRVKLERWTPGWISLTWWFRIRFAITMRIWIFLTGTRPTPPIIRRTLRWLNWR